MPIQLTNAFSYDPGHSRTPEVYPHVYVIELVTRPIEKLVRVCVQYGTYTPATGAWVPGQVAIRWIEIINEPAYVDSEGRQVPPDPKYDLFLAGDTRALPHAVDQYLIDEGFYAGTVV